MSQRIWSGWLALLAATRGTLFRVCLVGLMLVSVFGSRSAAQFPNCDCGTLSNLCGGGNEESCWYYEWYCYPQGYCQCMDIFNDSGWCVQFSPSGLPVFCGEPVACPDSVQVSGGGQVDVGGSLWLSATAMANGQPSTVEGTWSWNVSNPSVGNVSGAGSNATFTATGPGSAAVVAGFQAENCGYIDGGASVSACPVGPLSLSGPEQLAPLASADYAIGGYPGNLPSATSCTLSNPGAGSTSFTGSACRLTAGWNGWQSTEIQVQVNPGSACPTLSSAKTVLEQTGCSSSGSLSPEDWAWASSRFPNLVQSMTGWLGPATNQYNCLAWAGGITSEWIDWQANYDGGDTLTVQELDRFYSTDSRVTHRTGIYYYGFGPNNIQHAVRLDGGPGPSCWASSKLGGGILIAHVWSQLDGALYGSPVTGR